MFRRNWGALSPETSLGSFVNVFKIISGFVGGRCDGRHGVCRSASWGPTAGEDRPLACWASGDSLRRRDNRNRHASHQYIGHGAHASRIPGGGWWGQSRPSFFPTAWWLVWTSQPGFPTRTCVKKLDRGPERQMPQWVPCFRIAFIGFPGGPRMDNSTETQTRPEFRDIVPDPLASENRRTVESLGP